jgi:hypothetical protein
MEIPAFNNLSLPADFIKATETIYSNKNMTTYLQLPLMKE